MEYVDRPAARRAQAPEMDADGAANVLGALRGTEFFEPIMTAFCCGVRRGELLALRREDIDTNSRILKVRLALMHRDGRRDIKAPKTEKGRRDIPLAPYLSNLLKEHLERQEERLRLLGGALRSTPLFDNGFGMHWNPDAFGKAYRRELRKHSLSVVRLGGSRHGFASIARDIVDPFVIKEMMGHESLTTTAGYGRASLDAKRKAAERISDELERRLGT